MSEEEKENKQNVCENFEPHAWKKNKCKNCFQPPESHANVATENGGTHDKNKERSVSPSKKGSAATSLKDKYEQLERDKEKPKAMDSPHTLPKTKGKGGLASLTEMYNTLDMKSGKLPESPSANIPPPVFPKSFKKDGDSSLKKSKFGSVENVNSIEADSQADFGMNNKFKFGSMENISSVFDKKKDNVLILVQKSKVGAPLENVAPATSLKPVAQKKDTPVDIVNKLDAFHNELKAGTSSKSGPTVIHQQKDGNIDIIKLPPEEKKSEKKSLKLDIKSDNDKRTFGDRVDDTPKAAETPSTKDTTILRSFKDALSPTRNETKSGLSPTPKDDLKSPIGNLDKDNKPFVNLKDQLKSPTPDKDRYSLLNMKDRLKSPPHNEDSKSETLSFKDRLNTQTTDNIIDLKGQLKSPTPETEKTPDFDPKTKAVDDKQPEKVSTGLSYKDQLKQKCQSKEDEDIKSPAGEQKTCRPINLRDNLKSETGKQESKQIGKSETDSKKGFSFKDSLKSSKKDEIPAETHREKDSLSNKTSSMKDKLLPKVEPTLTNKLTSLKDKLKPKEETDSKVKIPDFRDKLKSKNEPEAKAPNKLGDVKDKLKPLEDTSNKPCNKLTDLKDKLKSKNEPESKTENKLTDLKDAFKSKNEPESKTEKRLTDFKDILKSKNEPESKTENKLTGFKDKLKLKEETETKSTNKLNDFRDKLKSKNETDAKSACAVTDFRDKLKSKDVPDSKTAHTITDIKDKLKSKEDSETVAKKTDLRDTFKTKSDLESKATNKVFDSRDKLKSKKDEEITTIKVKDYRDTLKSKVKDELKSNIDSKDNGNEKQKTDEKDTKENKESKSHVLSFKDRLQSTKSEKDFRENDNKNSNSKEINDSSTEKKLLDTNTSESNKTVSKDDSIKLFPQKTDTFGDISPEPKSDDKGDACAATTSAALVSDNSPLHVDTQVFTSSRNKTSGVNNLVADGAIETVSGSTKRQSDILELDFKRDKSPGDSRKSDKDKGVVIPNGDIRDSFRSMENVSGKKPSVVYNESEIEKLKEELINMTERCQNLEKENTLLSDNIKKKDANEAALQKQKDDVEASIKGMRQQLKSLEEKCQKLENVNVNLINDMQSRRESNHVNKTSEKEPEESDEKMSAREKLMEDIIEENEQFKEEITELKLEMEEMYDSFRDQEAEEFRELQKELDFTAKNCRILQFKLRKMERRNEQSEKDKATYEERLRKLQNQFQDRDAVAHIHSLEDELRMAKDVSVRLHDEIDLLEDRRGKVEEENRHLTELLEQADRKQFRLELEVDKLRDKVIELRQELRTREVGPDGEPRKLNCSEFLALHRESM